MTGLRKTAIVYSVEKDGLRLLFPDQSEAGEKRYPYNRSVSFSVGDRVFLIPTENSYVVAFPI